MHNARFIAHERPGCEGKRSSIAMADICFEAARTQQEKLL